MHRVYRGLLCASSELLPTLEAVLFFDRRRTDVLHSASSRRQSGVVRVRRVVRFYAPARARAVAVACARADRHESCRARAAARVPARDARAGARRPRRDANVGRLWRASDVLCDEVFGALEEERGLRALWDERGLSRHAPEEEERLCDDEPDEEGGPRVKAGDAEEREPASERDDGAVREDGDDRDGLKGDAPRANEIVVAVVVTDSGRPHPRVGGLQVHEIVGQDGLR